MKHLYPKLFTILCIPVLLLFASSEVHAQCPVGYPPGTTAFDTTIATPTGINTMQIKFPKFDPQQGMVTCVRLCVSITGVVDSVGVENNSASSQTANIDYIRTDQITGPGLVSPLTNSVMHSYGPFTVGGTDGILGSGPDYVAVSRDTVLNRVTICRNISDSATLSSFYGLDSVTYNYSIMALTNTSCTGGNYNSTVATSAFVNFRFEYCTCPGVSLPLNVYNFVVKKIGQQKAELKWNSFDNNSTYYHFEPEVSRDGINFQKISVIPKQNNGDQSYSYIFDMLESGRYFFRIRQANDNGRSYFTHIKYVDAELSSPVKFIVYPNPSNGIVGIKFDNNSAGKYLVLINNAQGQTVVSKEVEVYGSSYQQVARLNKGFYWVRVIEPISQVSSVMQLLIK